ncbi:MAG: ADP-ribosylglycohydrolase family protein, partial [Bacteroidota bacterium]
MLIELAIGDAYGAGFEYVDKEIVLNHNNLTYRQHPRHLGTKPGMYTDDTQMSLAIAELMVSGEEWTEINIANRFVEVFKRDEREGYAGGFYHFLQKITGGQEFLDKINGTSDKSGAAMRAPVIGIYRDRQEVLEKSRIQAALTHDSKDGINAAQAAAMIVHFFLWEGGRKQDLAKYIKSHVKGDWLSRWTGKVRSKGWMSVRAAITAIQDADTMSDLLKRCISFTGDVDTVAAIALPGASVCRELKNDLPTWLYYELENGPFGRIYIENL